MKNSVLWRMKTMSTRTYNFAAIRTSDWLYVDKTAWLYRLVTEESQRFYFLARLRRFGKSLMISTLQNIFEGRKALFRGSPSPRAVMIGSLTRSCASISQVCLSPR